MFSIIYPKLLLHFLTQSTQFLKHTGLRDITSMHSTTKARTTELERVEEQITPRKDMSIGEEQFTDLEGAGCKSSFTYAILILAFVLLRMVVD